MGRIKAAMITSNKADMGSSLMVGNLATTARRLRLIIPADSNTGSSKLAATEVLLLREASTMVSKRRTASKVTGKISSKLSSC